MADAVVRVQSNRAVIILGGGEIVGFQAAQAAAPFADRAEAALAQIEQIATGAPDAPSVLNKVNRDGSNAGGDFLTTVGVASDFLPLTGVEWIENPEWVNIAASKLNDGKLYSTIAGRLSVSTDFGNTWTSIGPAVLAGGQVAYSILPTGDGEVLFFSANRIYKSSGWPSSNFTTTLVFTNPTASTIFTWGVDGVPSAGLFVVTAYAAGGLAGFQESRYVWLSQDNGATWSVIRDLEAIGKNDQHIHFAVFDPWQNNRIYIGHHNFDSATGSGKAIEYSDDRGASWSNIDINLTVGGASMIVQPTTAVATPGGIVFGSDDNVSGLFVLRRGQTKLEFLAEGPPEDFGTGVRVFARHSQADPETGVIYTCFVTQLVGGHSFIMASDWRAGSVVFDDGVLPDTPGGAPGFYHFAFTPHGIVALARRPSSANPAIGTWWIMRAKRAERGIRRMDSGRMLGGSVGSGNVRNTAVGYASFAGALRSVAIGYKAQTIANGNVSLAIGPNASAVVGDRGFAIGADSVANTFGHALGHGALAGTSSVSIGDNAGIIASTSAVAIGRNAKSNGNSVAVGNSAVNSVGSLSVAVGDSASAANAAVAIGQGSVATNNCVSIGKGANTTGNAVGIGLNAKALGADGTAVGSGSEAATNGVALGKGAKTTHANAVALGVDTASTQPNQVMVGPRDVEITDAAKGLVLNSPDGSRWRMTISNAGVAAWTKP